MKIGIKVGSKLLTDGNGKIYKRFIAEICRQIAELKDEGHQVFLVTSGAIKSDSKTRRSEFVRAAVGQVNLISIYSGLFAVYGYEVGQVLPTFHYLSEEKDLFVKNFLDLMADPEIVPIINYNDFLDDKMIRALHEFRDNDILFRDICLLSGVDLAIIGFYEEGLYDSHNRLRHIIRAQDYVECLSWIGEGNELGYNSGKSGMLTKTIVLIDLAKAGKTSVLAPGREKDFIIRSARGEKYFGTVFLRPGE